MYVLKVQGKVTNSSTQVNLIDDDFGVVFELVLLVSNIKREVSSVLELFQVFLEIHMKKIISQHIVFYARL
jgi:hypothetical protein